MSDGMHTLRAFRWGSEQRLAQLDAELMLDADNADLTDDEPVKLSGGWLIFEQFGSKHRVRLSCIERYAYSQCADVTFVHVAGRVEEISGDHSAVLDTYFAEHPDT
jgi:hypothetical protein